MFWLWKDTTKKGFRTVDKIVTSLILWGVVASVYGVRKYQEKHKDEVQKAPSVKKKGLFMRIVSIIFWVNKWK